MKILNNERLNFSGPVVAGCRQRPTGADAVERPQVTLYM